MTQPRGRAKLADVARAAGVSPATVSRVLNGNSRVDPQLAKRVHEARAELGYRGNSLARGLRKQENNVIGVLVPDVTNPFFTDLVRSIEDTLRSHGMLLVLCNTDETPGREEDYLGLLIDQQVAGIIVAPVFEHSTLLPELAGGQIPLVAIDREIDGAKIDAVVFDNVEGARRLTCDLLRTRSRVAAIMGPLRTSTGSGRLQGYELALEEAGVALDTSLIVESDYSVRGGYEAARALLTAPEPPDAIFSGNNLMTLGVLRFMNEFGVEAGAVGLASFTAQPETQDKLYPVRSLNLETYKMGKIAAELLMERIGGARPEPRRVVLPVSHVG